MGESYFWKPFAQGVATPIVLIGGTNLLLKDFKVSNPYLYWGGLAASSAVVLGILADKIKVPILNAESDNCPICKGDIYGDMSMIGEEIVPDICGDCDIYVMPQGSDFKVRCMECGYGDIYGSRTPCEECESIADKMEAVNNRMNAETFESEMSKATTFAGKFNVGTMRKIEGVNVTKVQWNKYAVEYEGKCALLIEAEDCTDGHWKIYFIEGKDDAYIEMYELFYIKGDWDWLWRKYGNNQSEYTSYTSKAAYSKENALNDFKSIVDKHNDGQELVRNVFTGNAEEYESILGQRVKIGSKKHQILTSQVKHFNDLDSHSAETFGAEDDGWVKSTASERISGYSSFLREKQFHFEKEFTMPPYPNTLKIDVDGYFTGISYEDEDESYFNTPEFIEERKEFVKTYTDSKLQEILEKYTMSKVKIYYEEIVATDFGEMEEEEEEDISDWGLTDEEIAEYKQEVAEEKAQKMADLEEEMNSHIEYCDDYFKRQMNDYMSDWSYSWMGEQTNGEGHFMGHILPTFLPTHIKFVDETKGITIYEYNNQGGDILSYDAETEVFNASMYKCPDCSFTGYQEEFLEPVEDPYYDAETFEARTTRKGGRFNPNKNVRDGAYIYTHKKDGIPMNHDNQKVRKLNKVLRQQGVPLKTKTKKMNAETFNADVKMNDRAWVAYYEYDFMNVRPENPQDITGLKLVSFRDYRKELYGIYLTTQEAKKAFNLLKGSLLGHGDWKDGQYQQVINGNKQIYGGTSLRKTIPMQMKFEYVPIKRFGYDTAMHTKTKNAETFEAPKKGTSHCSSCGWNLVQVPIGTETKWGVAIEGNQYYYNHNFCKGIGKLPIKAETFNSDSHTDSFMADMPVNAIRNGDGWFIPSIHRKDYKETFKNWSPNAYPYEKRITQDSVNEGCNSCGKENVHYQFYLAQKNSVNPKMRFVDGATHCHYDPNTCGGNICGDCADNASCENCGGEICSFCEEENNYDHSDLVCVDCREFNESLEDD